MPTQIITLSEAQMTESQKEYIKTARKRGDGYKKIAGDINLPLSTVKMYCLRSSETEDKKNIIKNQDNICRNCGKPIKSNLSHREKQFCSRECGLQWWHKHPEEMKKKAFYTNICPFCGKTFTSYGCKTRKYCSHSCYINHRYGGKHDSV